MDYDVIVAGGGPAGATAAYWLRQGGCRVLLLEKERLPRYKTCGGALPIDGMRMIPFDVSSAVEAEARRMSCSIEGYPNVTWDIPGAPIAMVMRDRLDYLLVSHSGAEVRDGVSVTGVIEDATGVTVETAGGENLRARYVVAADGATSTVARSLGLRRNPTLAGALEAEARVSDRMLAENKSTIQIRFASVPYGYAWLFPKGDHLSLGVGALRHGRPHLREALQREAARLGIDLAAASVHGHPIPVYWQRDMLQARRTVLVGDAAGLADGLVGEGIRYSMRSARLAAQAILAGNVAGYSRLIHSSLGRNLTWARRCGNIFYTQTALCFRLGIPNHGLRRLFSDTLAGSRTYLDMFWLFPGYAMATLLRNPRLSLSTPRRQRVS